jgi:hypothetical protein
MSAFYRVDFQSSNNEDLRQAFVLTDEAGTPIDITGAALRMGVETAAGRDALEATTANGRIVVSDAPAGRFDLAIPAAVMRTLAEGAYRHDLVLESGGTTRRVWAGTLTLGQGVAP